MTIPQPKGRLFGLSQLSEKGITFSKNHVRRLVKAGRFPAPIYISERRPAWPESVLDCWIAKLEAERDRRSQ